MIEIKFRGMTIHGEWVYGLLCKIYVGKEAGNTFISNRAGRPLAYQIRPETVGQFTGLKDKNGKEIYEGDIVKHRELNRPGDDVMYGIAIRLINKRREVKFERCGFTPFIGWVDDALKDLEWDIIGNIYEDPDSLNPPDKSSVAQLATNQ